MVDPILQVSPPMLSLVLRASLLTLALLAASLVFAEELLISALILVTIVLIAVSMVLGREGQEGAARLGAPGESETA